MLAKLEEHQKAVELRKQGKSYSEILSQVSVSQSSLSLWLKDIPLTKQQKDLLLLRKKLGQIKGGTLKRKARQLEEKQTIEESAKEIKEISKKELWLLGIIAYWCEGSKQKAWNVSQGVIFTNSDPFLLKLFIKWMKEFCHIKSQDIKYNLYIHENGDINSALNYWSKVLKLKPKNFSKTSIKKHNILTRRKNTRENYHGLIRITIRKSTNLNRKIKGWVIGINNLI